MCVRVTRPTDIMVDNMSVVLNASNPGSTLNKKHIALSYPFVQEHLENDVIRVLKIGSSDNYADPFTKGMPGPEHGDFMHELMKN